MSDCLNCPVQSETERVEILLRLANHLVDKLAAIQAEVDEALNDAGDILYGCGTAESE